MTDIEKILLESIKKSGDTEDLISKSLKKQDTPEKEIPDLQRKLIGLAIGATIACSTYLGCIELLNTKYNTLVIPAGLYGICAANYSYKKISGKQ